MGWACKDCCALRAGMEACVGVTKRGFRTALTPLHRQESVGVP